MSAPPLTAAALERQLFDRYGLLLTQQQLAAFLGRTPAGLRWSLANPADARTFALRDCARRWGGACITPPARSRYPRWW